MVTEGPQDIDRGSLQLDALMKNVSINLASVRTQQEADSVIDRGFRSLLVFIPDVNRAGKIMDGLIKTHSEALKTKGIDI